MGFVDVQLWKCKKCGFEFRGEAGCYEIDPNDMDTTLITSAYHCPKCGSVRNISDFGGFCSSDKAIAEGYVPDDHKCKECDTEMEWIDEPKFKFLQKGYKCPQCKRKTLKFVEIEDVWQT